MPSQTPQDACKRWLSHLLKGTTRGYATRKDCIAVSVFFFLICLALASLYHLAGYILDISKEALNAHIEGFPFLLYWLTIIANLSLFFMRINDIFGKHCFAKKSHVIAFVIIFIIAHFAIRMLYLEGILETAILKIYFDVWLTILACIILCAYPSSPNKKDEMPAVEYKLPKKTIGAFLLIIFVLLSLSLHGLILFCHNIKESDLKCPARSNSDTPPFLDGKIDLYVKENCRDENKCYLFLKDVTNFEWDEFYAVPSYIDINKVLDFEYPFDRYITTAEIYLFLKDGKIAYNHQERYMPDFAERMPEKYTFCKSVNYCRSEDYMLFSPEDACFYIQEWITESGFFIKTKHAHYDLRLVEKSLCCNTAGSRKCASHDE